MQCKKCHHTDEAHEHSENSSSIIRRGACKIPNCPCRQYKDAIQEIDEDLL